MTSPIDPLRPTLGPAPWFGRLVAGFYDLFILLAVWLIVSNLIQFIFGETQANLMQAALLLSRGYFLATCGLKQAERWACRLGI